jgi:hypothetical protein
MQVDSMERVVFGAIRPRRSAGTRLILPVLPLQRLCNSLQKLNNIVGEIAERRIGK